MSDVLAAHRAFYDAVETGDADLMAALWVDDPGTTCVHPGAPPLQGTAPILRSWTVLMAGVGYIQFFLTDVEVSLLPAKDPTTAIVVCTENILSDGGSVESFNGGRAVATSILVRDGGRWRFWARHASPLIDPEDV
ncbi:nuclear transport factor 2 family protein [Aeromicrobium duanguangcaii]|uniref:Nuclear transport factor 2 family protein n=1 Tax=Aeromicrobium duanguangcaii TaxID=2968086 RepID=A0ABY5KGM8_9ACTN|nr:nuclear transport factor 2 family protein [Aeromicrobium duanguangcaii]MCD9155148.1 nuclear transport factor 2 family protein [Aeromicrobium duanguangcaii]UUI68200.1 nuclear transport factor 2 family protein [Aeromicrobium duanguangcaii]